MTTRTLATRALSLTALTVALISAPLGCGGSNSNPSDPTPGGQVTLTEDSGVTAEDTSAADTGAGQGPDTASPMDSGEEDSGGFDTEGFDDAGNMVEVNGDRGRLVHSFGAYRIEGGQERSPCVSWTLNNEEPLYVEKVTLSNNGAYHHSNWFVVPEDVYPGDDGYWRCSSRDFDEVASALDGTVLFAQSTQSRYEEQVLGEGIVIKIPPRYKVVADVHLLNLSTRAVETDLRMSLEVIHPTAIQTIATPFRMVYTDLNIPPEQRSRFTGQCDLSTAFASQTGSDDVDMDLFWVLPHYHNLGDYFSLEVIGGPMDGQSLFELDGFNAEANGQAFNPPVPLSGATGLRFTCGYNNPRSRRVGWGIGDQEMCVMLGFARSPVIIDGLVLSGNRQVGADGDVSLHEGDCLSLAYAPNPDQGPPDDDELTRPLYVPESNPEDIDLPPVPECEDVDPAADPALPATLTSVHDTIFAPSCTFTSCHDVTVPAAGLDLTREGLYERLRAYESPTMPEIALVAPGDPDNSSLYRRLAACEPTTAQGFPLNHMPLNSPTLLEPEVIAKLRAWIADGAPDN